VISFCRVALRVRALSSAGHFFCHMTTYDRLHRQCRTLENLFDSKLTTYAQLVATVAQPKQDVEASGSSSRWKDLEQELDDLLLKVRIYTCIIGRI
jgi:hypothetical protein